MMYMVKYKVNGQNYEAGPYSHRDALYQLEDIRGFEGVTDARLVALEDS